MNLNTRNITPEQAQKILSEHGTVVSLEEAENILRVVYNFGGIAAQQVDREFKAAKSKRKPKNI